MKIGIYPVDQCFDYEDLNLPRLHFSSYRIDFIPSIIDSLCLDYYDGFYDSYVFHAFVVTTAIPELFCMYSTCDDPTIRAISLTSFLVFFF